MKYGLAFVPSTGLLNPFTTAFHRSMRQVQLTRVQRLEMSFDPFTGKEAESLRLFAYHVDTSRIRQTNFKCAVKLNVVCDRTEPSVSITMYNGDKARFRTQNLNAKEVVDEFNTLCEIYERKALEEEQKKKKRR